jgi:cytochrome c biogenesis protein CcmG/thiol:disulfide interchange protein DsbE
MLTRISRRSILRLGLIAPVVVATGCSYKSSPGKDLGVVDWTIGSNGIETGPQIGQRAPNFRLQTSNGETISLQAELGRPVLLNFFASWCLNCREEIDALQTFSHADPDSLVLGINLRETASVVAKLASSTGAMYPMALDTDGAVSRSYRVTSLPATYFIDASGVVQKVIHGPVTSEDFQSSAQSAARSHA